MYIYYMHAKLMRTNDNPSYLTDRLQYYNYVVFLKKYTYLDYFQQYRLYCVIYVAMTVN